MKALLSFLLSFSLCFALQAQSLHDAPNKPEHYCATEEQHEFLLRSDTAYASRVKQTEELIYKRLATKNQRTEGNTTIYTIPVVVHIIHNNGPENISDQQVIDGIKDLNDAFRHRSPYDGMGGADIRIEFCLSSQDTSGNSTTGINRIQSTLTQYNVYANEQAMKGSTSWDSKRYLNIWIVREICLQTECRINGYSTFPFNHGLLRDGIVVLAQRFGSSPIDSKIHIHEIGHYFDLYHTFTNCTNTDCLLNGDYVCDTPPDDSGDPIPCGTFINSCTTDEDDLSSNNPFRPIAYGGLGDQNDMTQNYMDYGNLDCMNIFTEGQKVRMIAALLNVRSSLLLSNGCKPQANSDYTPPNLVTANGDGHNDSFQVIGLTPGFTLELYNQWDALVYKKENYDNTFDAAGLDSNIYFYNLYHPKTGQSYRGWLHVVVSD